MESKKDFWKNSDDTVGFAACDLCVQGSQLNNTSTYQNGKKTLCKAHYEGLK